jgi:hypothetical protein
VRPRRSLDDVDPTDVRRRVSYARKPNPDPVSGKVEGAVSESGQTGKMALREVRGRGLTGVETMRRKNGTLISTKIQARAESIHHFEYIAKYSLK